MRMCMYAEAGFHEEEAAIYASRAMVMAFDRDEECISSCSLRVWNFPKNRWGIRNDSRDSVGVIDSIG